MTNQTLEMADSERAIRECAASSSGRFDLWTRFLKSIGVERMAEIGVYRGDFASRILAGCNSIKKYYMVDPWRHLECWNKPANQDDDTFEQFLSETKSKTDFAKAKRRILRGQTAEMAGEIADDELDFAYIDGDHTLRGITIDLVSMYPKVKVGGWIGGDDFTPSVWQHSPAFEPTLVFPFAVHFAEAVGARLYALPYSQFLLRKGHGGSFELIDLVGDYADCSMGRQLHPEWKLGLRMSAKFPRIAKILGGLGLFGRMPCVRAGRDGKLLGASRGN